MTPLISSLYMGFSRYSMEQKHRLWKNRTIFFIIASNLKKKNSVAFEVIIFFDYHSQSSHSCNKNT